MIILESLLLKCRAKYGLPCMKIQSNANQKNDLGIENGKWGGTFEWRHADKPSKKGFTAWSIFDESTDYTKPSTKDAMINYRVENLEELLKTLKEEGVEVVGEMEVFNYEKFSWMINANG